MCLCQRSDLYLVLWKNYSIFEKEHYVAQRDERRPKVANTKAQHCDALFKQFLPDHAGSRVDQDTAQGVRRRSLLRQIRCGQLRQNLTAPATEGAVRCTSLKFVTLLVH